MLIKTGETLNLFAIFSGGPSEQNAQAQLILDALITYILCCFKLLLFKMKNQTTSSMFIRKY